MLSIIAQIKPSENICAGPFCDSIANPGSAVGLLIARLFNIILIIGAAFTLVYLMWGAFDWITSAGAKERLAKAQKKLTQAVVGLIVLFVVWTLWAFVTGDVLGIIKKTGDGWTITLPTLQ